MQKFLIEKVFFTCNLRNNSKDKRLNSKYDYSPAVLIPKFFCSPSETNCQSSSPSTPCMSSLSKSAISGFIDAVLITGPITSGK